jgi:hypothetical protein
MPRATVEKSKEWTLRLKRGTRTVLLFVDPAQSLASLKQSLLDALNNAPKDLPETTPAPDSIDQIEIGIPVDLFDFSQGFQAIEEDQDISLDGEDDVKQKGKSRASKGSASSIQSLGVKKNYVLAYRFKEDNEEQDETMGEDQGWDVEIPVFQDLYGIEVAGDLGANLEFRG